MSASLFVVAALVLSQKETVLAQDDQEAAAITVYRNPEFFRHLSNEFNSFVGDFGAEKPFFGSKNEYISPFKQESYQNHDDGRDEESRQQSIDESESQLDAPDDEESYRDEAVGGESEGGGFNTFNPSEFPNGNLREGVRYNGEQLADYDEDYKYPGEPKKPNVPVSPSGGGNFDPAPDFHHPPRRLPPKKPKKKGRGPYGHPRFATEEDRFRNGDEKRETLRYNDDFDEGKINSEEQQLADVENENRGYQNAYHEETPRHQELQFYHNGQRYPLNVKPYSEPNEPLQEEFPLGHYDYYHPYPPTGEEPYVPAAQNVHINNEAADLEPLKAQKHLDFRDSKKGTREYLKFHKYPPNHELQDLTEPSNVRKTPNIVVGCSTVVRQKRPRKFVAYRVKPVYAHYKVVPVYYTTANRLRPTVLYKRSAKTRHRPPVGGRARTVADDSVYTSNSEFDQDYQNLNVIKKKSS